MALAPARGPSGLHGLRMAREAERAVGHIAQYGGARGYINVVTHLDRRHELRVASHHAAIADLGEMLLVAVVVHCNHAASDVGVGADRGIAEVTQMARLGAAPDARLLGLDEVADAVVAGEFGAGAQVRERSDLTLFADAALLGAHAQLQMAAIADRHVAQPRGAFDHDAASDPAAAENLHVGPDHDVAAELGFFADIGGRGVDERDPGGHQAAVGFAANV